MGEAAPQSVEGGGVLTHRDELLSAQAQEITLSGITGIVEGAVGGSNPEAHQLVFRGAVVGKADHRSTVAGAKAPIRLKIANHAP